MLAIAITENNNVFALVTFSWSALASGLGPLLVVRVLEKPINTPVALIMMLTGILAALTWNLLGYSSIVYEVLPGMLAGALVYFVYLLISPKHSLKN